MISFRISWKSVIWAVAIITLILLIGTALFYQHNVNTIDQQLDNIRTNAIR